MINYEIGLFLLCFVAVFMFLKLVRWLSRPFVISSSRPYRTTRYEFTDENHKQCVFPVLKQPPQVDISLIVPAYNESKRLPIMMRKTLKYLEGQNIFSNWEIIIVCDGCSDNTVEVSQAYVKHHGSDKIRVLHYPTNMGKGFAVQQGMLHARGECLLFVDADGASEISHLEHLHREQSRLGKLSIAVGSRAHLAEASTVKRDFIRTILMYGFHSYIGLLGCRGIKDTQCGFKLFSRQAALLCFGNQNLTRWLFDVEILLLAQWNNIPVTEVFIDWQEIDGSKMQLVEASLTMARDLIVLRLCYALGFWKILTKQHIEAYLSGLGNVPG